MDLPVAVEYFIEEVIDSTSGDEPSLGLSIVLCSNCLVYLGTLKMFLFYRVSSIPNIPSKS